MPEIWMNKDAALTGVPVNIAQLIDDTDFKSIEASVVYNQAGLVLLWNFITTAGVYTQTAVTPTTGGGDYDWVNKGNGMYAIGMPASGGASANNDTAGVGWFSGAATGVLPWVGPRIGFRAARLNNLLVNDTYVVPEPGVKQPPATPDLFELQAWLYAKNIFKITATDSEEAIHSSADVKQAKATTSESSGTVTRERYGSGA